MKRLAILIASIAGLAAGATFTDRLPPAEAQRAPATTDCGASVTEARQQLRATRRAQTRAAQARAQAEEELARAEDERRLTERLLANERARVKRLEEMLGPSGTFCDFGSEP